VGSALLAAGQIAGLVKTSYPVREIIEEMMVSFEMTVRRLQALTSALRSDKPSSPDAGKI
jgi:hypothetical protein